MSEKKSQRSKSGSRARDLSASHSFYEDENKMKSSRRRYRHSSEEDSSPDGRRQPHKRKRRKSPSREVKRDKSSGEDDTHTRKRSYKERSLFETGSDSKNFKNKNDRSMPKDEPTMGQSPKYSPVLSERSKSHDHERRGARHVASASESEADSEEEIMFEWEQHKWELNQMFFREEDIIKQGTHDYHDFFKFLRKYQALSKQKKLQKVIEMQATKPKKSSHSKNSASASGTSPKFGLPLQFDNKHLVNFTFKNMTEDLLVRRLPPRDLDDKKKRLSRRRIREFRTIILLYLNFNQKKSFEKLQQLRSCQKALPIAQFRDDILRTVSEHNIVLVAGDTGCGKSTQVPQYLMAGGYNKIACTQPRRIACISLCKRVAHETLHEHGSLVGFQIRFERHTSEHTKVLFLTEGLLLRQVQSDPTLAAYDVVILDEIHERHLHTDFLLGVVKCLLLRRPGLKVILMSATINLDLFSKYFLGQAPVIQVPGRLHPITLQYLPVPLLEQASDKLNPAPFVRVLQLIDSKYPQDERGDVLMFLSGVSEINTVVEAAKLYAQHSRRWIILSLHSNLSVADQERVFDVPPEGVRKCIVSTNIAETSVTIDGVRFVVDSGKVKEMSYDAACQLRRLKEFWVSQASAQQRKGRAGRTGPGVCYRLYSEAQYDAFQPYSTPEIQRVPLESLVLQMISMGLPDVKLFPFIEPPPPDSLEVALSSLQSLAAVTDSQQLTSTGQLLAHLPVDVRVGKMLLVGCLFHQAETTLTLAAALSVQTVFTSRADRDPECAVALQQLCSLHGDPFTLLSVYRGWLEEKCGGEGREAPSSRAWCRRRGVEEQRLYELTKLRHQFCLLLQDSKLHQPPPPEGGPCTTAAERARRHGELQQLKALRRTVDQTPSRKVKVLKVDRDGAPLSDDEAEAGVDKKHLDFAIRHDPKQLRRLLQHADLRSFKDIIMLKVILTSGLYPNVAIADDHNTYRPNSEQLFHTPSKPFAALHPTSVLAKHPEVLQLSDADIVEVPGFRGVVATRHQILVYVSLLETNKAFLMNSFRVPTAQTLLLFARKVDSNADFSTLVFDAFMELCFPEPHVSQELVAQAVQLRGQWDQLLDLKLRLGDQEACDLEVLSAAGGLERTLSQGLVQFYMLEPLHSQRRLLPADVKVLHKGPGMEDAVLDPNPFTGAPLVPHPQTGGHILTSYLTYNSLTPTLTASTPMAEAEAPCGRCGALLVTRPLQHLEHLAHCAVGPTTPKGERQDPCNRPPHTQAYRCDHCSETLWLSIPQIFAHKRSHSSRAHSREEPSSRAHSREEPSSRARSREEPSSRARFREEPSIRPHSREEPSSWAHSREEPSIRPHSREEPSSRPYSREKPSSKSHNKRRSRAEQ